MKFTSLLSLVLVFALSAVNAIKGPVIIRSSPVSGALDPMHKIHAFLYFNHTNFEILLRTEEPNWLASYDGISFGGASYDQLPTGEYAAVINDNDANGGNRTFRIDLSKPGEEFHFEGSSLAHNSINDLPADPQILSPILNSYCFHVMRKVNLA